MSVFSDGVATAFKVANDFNLLTTAVFSSIGFQAYDNITGLYSTNDEPDTANIVKYDFKSINVDGETVRKGDTRLLAQESELNYPNYKYITIGAQKWTVKNFETDPSNSIRIFHVRLQCLNNLT